MGVNVRETQDVNFFPGFEAGTDVIAVMSMAVIRTNDYYQTLLRQVQRQDNQPVPISVLAFCQSRNGVDFERSGKIALQPQQFEGSEDRLAVEDPTIVELDGVKYVFHTAVKPKDGGQGVIAATRVVSGAELTDLNSKRQIVLDPREIGKALGRTIDMVKEPEFFRMKDGSWRTFYEFADGHTSRIGMAWSENLTGPYKDHQLLMDTRGEGWDCQHVSPGPIMMTSRGDVLMLYNGQGPKSAENQTPQWAIGTAIIDAATGGVVEGSRSDKPIIVPPDEIGPGSQLIAFANSIIPTEQKLYYTVADKRSRMARLALDNI